MGPLIRDECGIESFYLVIAGFHGGDIYTGPHINADTSLHITVRGAAGAVYLPCPKSFVNDLVSQLSPRRDAGSGR